MPDAIDRDHLDVLHVELPCELVVPDAFDPEHPDREADAFTSQGASPAQPVVERPVVVHDKGPAAWSGGDEIGLVKRRQRLANRRPAGREALGELMLTGESGPSVVQAGPDLRGQRFRNRFVLQLHQLTPCLSDRTSAAPEFHASATS